MARLRDIKVGMKVQIVKGKEDPEDFSLTSDECNIGAVGNVEDIDSRDTTCQVQVIVPGVSGWYYPASWIKIIKDEGETKMVKAQTKTEVKLQTYVLMGHNYVSQVFTDSSTKGVLNVANDVFSEQETIELLKDGNLKLFKIEEVKVEVTEPSIKIIG